MNRVGFLLYAWATTLILGACILYLATLSSLQFDQSSSLDILSKTTFRIILYFTFFLFLYRSIIITLKSTIDGLSVWRSNREKIEDTEFVLIIETLILIIAILASTIIAILDEIIQSTKFIEHRNSEVQGVLISEIAIITSAIVIYIVPVIGELEFAIKHRIQRLIKK